MGLDMLYRQADRRNRHQAVGPMMGALSKRFDPRGLYAMLIACVLASCPDKIVEGKPFFQDMNKSQYAAGEYIITMAKDVRPDFIIKYFSQYEVISVKAMEYAGENVYLLKIRKDPGPEEMQKKSAASANIKSIQPNYIYRMFK